MQSVNKPWVIPWVITVCFTDFYAISEQTMDYSLSYYLRMSWHDADLEFNPSENLGREEIILEPRDIVGELLPIPHILSIFPPLGPPLSFWCGLGNKSDLPHSSASCLKKACWGKGGRMRENELKVLVWWFGKLIRSPAWWGTSHWPVHFIFYHKRIALPCNTACWAHFRARVHIKWDCMRGNERRLNEKK